MEGYIYLQLLVIVISFTVCFSSPPSNPCRGGGWVTAIGTRSIAVAVVGRWYRAAVGASIAVIVVVMVGRWCPPVLSSPLLGPPLLSSSQWWVCGAC